MIKNILVKSQHLEHKQIWNHRTIKFNFLNQAMSICERHSLIKNSRIWIDSLNTTEQYLYNSNRETRVNKAYIPLGLVSNGNQCANLLYKPVSSFSSSHKTVSHALVTCLSHDLGSICYRKLSDISANSVL